MNSQRIGIFSISREYILEHPKDVSEMFFQLSIIPVRAELLWHNNTVEYHALSPYFDLSEAKFYPPRYEIIATIENKNGEHETTYKVEKINATNK